MTDEAIDLDELERMEREATAGPWRAGRSDMVSYVGDGNETTNGPFKNVYGPDKEPDEVVRAYRDECVVNAQLVAATRNALPELLRRARRLAELEGFLREHSARIDQALTYSANSLRSVAHLDETALTDAAKREAAREALAALMKEINDGKP